MKAKRIRKINTAPPAVAYIWVVSIAKIEQRIDRTIKYVLFALFECIIMMKRPRVQIGIDRYRCTKMILTITITISFHTIPVSHQL